MKFEFTDTQVITESLIYFTTSTFLNFEVRLIPLAYKQECN